MSQHLDTAPDTHWSSAYGWVIVVVAALAMVATLPGRTHGLGMISERLLTDPTFEWNSDSELARIEYSNINLWTTLVGGLFCLPCGWLIDRFGLRWMLTATIVFLAAAVFWMTHTTNLTQFSYAILLTRGFGQSALSVISITMVGKWFPGRLSMPMAIYTLLLSLGFAYAAQLAKPWADADWRVLWNGIGYCLLGIAVISAILTREPPRAMTGVLSPSSALGPAGRNVDSEVGFTASQAAGTQTFWVFGLAISLIALIGSGQSLFNESILVEQGFKKDLFYDLMSLTGLVGLIVKLPVGWLGQRVPLNRLLAAGMVTLAGCQCTLPSIESLAGIRVYAIVMGVSGTITTVLFFAIWGEAFGRKHLGTIQAIAQMMTVLASAAGPRVFAECFARYDNYDLAMYTLGGIAALIAVWSLTIRVPRPEDAPQANSLHSTSILPQES